MRWKLSASHMSLSCPPSLCQKFSQLVETWQNYGKLILHNFLRHSVLLLISALKWLCLSLGLSVCHAPSDCFFFLFLDGIEPFLAVSSPCALLQNFFLDFWFRPPKAQNLLPKICTKSPISRLVWQIDRRCLGLPGVFRDGRFNGTMQNVVGPTLVAMATKFWLGAEIQSPTAVCYYY